MLITGRANTEASRYHSIADIMAEAKCKCRAALVLGAGEAIGQGVKSGDRILKL